MNLQKKDIVNNEKEMRMHKKRVAKTTLFFIKRITINNQDSELK